VRSSQEKGPVERSPIGKSTRFFVLCAAIYCHDARITNEERNRVAQQNWAEYPFDPRTGVLMAETELTLRLKCIALRQQRKRNSTTLLGHYSRRSHKVSVLRNWKEVERLFVELAIMTEI